MKKLFFDAGPIISLVLSNLSFILPKLKEKFNGKFYITSSVHYELVERPLKIKRFMFEAMQVSKMINDGILEVYDNIPKDMVDKLFNLANNSFSVKKKNLDIVQSGEMESLACAIKEKAEGIVIDERTLRLFIENSDEMVSLLEHRFKRKVYSHNENIKDFKRNIKNVSIIRSIELTGVAYKLGYLDKFIPNTNTGKNDLLDAVLWATKYNGCAVNEQEIEELKKQLII